MDGLPLTPEEEVFHSYCEHHTFIETCKMFGVSTLEYFKEFFKAASKREQTKDLLSVCRA